MRIRIIAIGQKMPAWVNEGYDEYARRITDDCHLELLELPMQKRTRSVSVEQCTDKEGKAILEALKPGEKLVALDVLGKAVSTPQLAELMVAWQRDGRHVAMAIGGPDGLSPAVTARAEETLSLSKLTLPHPLVRVLLSEQLYRAWSINHGHPYHR